MDKMREAFEKEHKFKWCSYIYEKDIQELSSQEYNALICQNYFERIWKVACQHQAEVTRDEIRIALADYIRETPSSYYLAKNLIDRVEWLSTKQKGE